MSARPATDDGVPPATDGAGVAEQRPAFGAARVERVARVDGPLRARLLRIWTDVSNAGGWVGFVPPVAEAEIAPVLDAALARVHAGRDWLAVVRTGAPDRPAPDDVAGFAFVANNDRLLSEHWRWVLRVQVHPEHQGARLGAVLLDGIADMAADDGLEMLLLTVRGGEGLEAFYGRAGYREVARIPRAIRVAPDDYRDQVHLAHHLR
ncbi:GNAT family N-acetyltransferase [Patulibacter sp. SYSU D01012]|uniref:GNAT family N-acetyltransferase n=1 Tax=Patulibacter sp. SYSU D01012 TaxID=2817381 RepID=UPI001FEF6238|nr:GNAT family N-acetyltransferase [Patulibacter sp. SYSU D01012]